MNPTNTWQILIRRVDGGFLVTKTSPNDPEFIYEEVLCGTEGDISDFEVLLNDLLQYFGEYNFKVELKDANSNERR